MAHPFRVKLCRFAPEGGEVELNTVDIGEADLSRAKDFAVAHLKLTRGPQWSGTPAEIVYLLDQDGNAVFRWDWWKELDGRSAWKDGSNS
jgi:hypothetical protein